MIEITKLAKRRLELNLTQKQAAEKAKIPYPTYQKLDNGTTDFSRALVNTAVRIARALETSIEELCE